MKAVLLPGEHWLANRRGSLEVSRHDLRNPEFVSAYEKALFDKLPDVAARHFTVVRT
ncbi:MAG: slipin family protein, partial [Mesorhizobium sp.]